MIIQGNALNGIWKMAVTFNAHTLLMYYHLIISPKASYETLKLI